MADEDTLSWFLPLFLARGPDGELLHSDDEVRKFLAVVLLSFGADPRTMPEAVAGMVGELGAKAGVVAGDPSEVARQKIEAYLAREPLPPDLVVAFQQGARGEIALRSPEELVLATGHVIGLRRALPPPEGTPLPAGATPGGPLARMGAEAALPRRAKQKPSKPTKRTKRPAK